MILNYYHTHTHFHLAQLNMDVYTRTLDTHTVDTCTVDTRTL